MNKQIQKLADQCYDDDLHWSSAGAMVFNKEKFAELIVQECADIIANRVLNQFPESSHAKKLLEHFGVKDIVSIKVGDRVKVTSGFCVGATATVKYIEPNGEKVWVRRDGSSSDVFYNLKELLLIKS